MSRQVLTNRDLLKFYDSSDTFLTECIGQWQDLSVNYDGKEVSPADVPRARSFFIPWNMSETLDVQHKIKIAGVSWSITSIKFLGSSTEIVGLKDSVAVAVVEESGIVSEFRFQSGELGTDQQGSNPLTLVNSPSHSSESGTNASPQDGSVDLESSSSERLEIADSVQQGLDITGSLTIVARIKMESNTDYNSIVTKWNPATSNLSYRLEVTNSGKLRGSLSQDGTTENDAVGNTTLSTATWYAVSLVYDSVDIRLYLDGSLDSNGSQNPKTYSSGIYNGASKFCIGARGNNQDHFDGLIDDVQIFNESKNSTKINSWATTGAWS